ncbi:MAG: flagellar biosynthesis anti-sigma factor FlgM [Armatimonadetes bacterium]|nr:flagellar biosynthesis anti-sigma factor FlgM [Armatimonadota bacterium]
MSTAMKIGPGPVDPIRPEQAQGAQRLSRAEGIEPGSRVEEVAAASQVQAAAEAVRAAAEVRAERVAEIKALLAKGEFKVDVARVAEAILRGL